MPNFRLPLSGNVNQTINPWTVLFNPVGSQFGLININLGRSSNPAVEEEVLNAVGSYGKQLGKIGDALQAILQNTDWQTWPDKDRDAVKALQTMLKAIEEIKTPRRKHHAEASSGQDE